jgi:hypothetical protein
LYEILHPGPKVSNTGTKVTKHLPEVQSGLTEDWIGFEGMVVSILKKYLGSW